MEHIDPAKARGADVTFDIYPYPTGSSVPLSLLPSPVQEGGPDAILRQLADPSQRARIAQALDTEHGGALDETICSYLPKNSHLEGTDPARPRGRATGSPWVRRCARSCSTRA